MAPGPLSDAAASPRSDQLPDPGAIDALVARIWTSRCRWSEAANAARDGVRSWRLVQLILAVAGAVLAAAAASMLPAEAAGDGQAVGHMAVRVLAFIGALALALVGFVQLWFLPPKSVEDWARLRSVSEGLKSEVYRFRAAAKPYQDDPHGAELTRKTSELEQSADDLAEALPPEPAKPSPPPGALDPAGYLDKRIDQQIRQYYLPESRKNRQKARHYRWLGIAAAFLGVVLSTAMGVAGASGLGIWVPVLTTLTAAFAAHAAVERYEFNAKSYAQHAQRLERLARAWQANPRRFEPEVWSDFVHECEETISIENRGWMADMLRKVDGVGDIVAKARADANS